MSSSHDILAAWFGDVGDGWRIPTDRFDLWFGRRPETDERLRREFEADVARAASGDLDGWALRPRGRLALIVLLDQMARNIYRGTPAAFEHDGKALALCLEGLARGDDAALSPIERAFMYMPLEHSEDEDDQHRAVTLFGALADAAPPRARESFASFLDYAVRHEAVIERFGRFPHRNRILGRASTPEEERYLAQPGAGF